MTFSVSVTPRGTSRVYVAPTSGAGTQFVPDYGELLRVSFSTAYEDRDLGFFGGHDLASWTVKPHGGYLGGLFRPGDHVKITKGGGTCFEGEYSEAEPADDGTFTLNARGYGYNLYDYESFFSDAGANTLYPTNRLTGGNLSTTFYGYERAIGAGMPLTQVVGTIPSAAWGASDAAPAPLKVGTVLTQTTRELNQRFAVWGRSLVIAAEATTPLWAYDPPDSVVGVADTDYATHVYVWYLVSAPNTYKLGGAIDADGLAKFDQREVTVDYRGAGLMTAGRANDIAASLLDQVKGRFVLAGNFTVDPGSGFKSDSGGIADIAFVQAGQRVRLVGVRTSQGTLLPEESPLIGRTEYTADISGADLRESLTVTPMGAVPRTLSTILQGQALDPGELMGGAA